MNLQAKTIFFVLIFLCIITNSCKNEKSHADIQQEQLLEQENELKRQKLELEQARLNSEIEAENERKRIIQEQEQFQATVDNEVTQYVNKIFLKWGSSWAIDNYIDESSIIEHFEKNNERLKFDGTFKFNRLGSTKIGRFEGIIELGNDEMKIKELCYFFESESSCI
mgnify:CR=1 FL=1|jgi:hypothetical protein